MNCEIEFLPVGEGTKAGDAIVVRYGTEDKFQLMIVDGGNADSGELVVEHIRDHYSDHVVAHALLTHADQDHASGLRKILEELPVQNLWLHQPWEAAADALPLFANKNFTVEGLKARIKGEYDIVAQLVAIAEEKRIPIHAPVARSKVGPFTVLSPTKAAYTFLVPQFDRTPDPDEEALRRMGWWLGKSKLRTAFDEGVQKLAELAQRWTTETWEGERLKDGGVTSASNESSVVLYGTGSVGPSLLTGDAGEVALAMAAGIADGLGLPLGEFACVQVPHHGSRRNVGPTILNRIVGPILPKGSASKLGAFVSAPKDDAIHPRKIVINAFTRRGASVVSTKGGKKVHYGGFRPKPGYGPAQGFEFQPQVEEYDE